MDLSFSEQVDQLLWHLKVELLKHHEHHRSGPVPRPTQVHPMPPEGPTAPIVTPQQLAEAMGSEATSVAAKGSLMGQVVTDSDSDDELQSPKPILKDLARAPSGLGPKIFGAVSYPSSAPPALHASEGAQRSLAQKIAQQPTSPGGSSVGASPASPASPKRTRSNLSSKGKFGTSESGFASSSDEEVFNHSNAKPLRRTGSSVPDFLPEFFRQSVHPEKSQIYNFVEDPDSGRWAFYFSQLQNCFLLMTSAALVWQASRIPGTTMLPNTVEINIMHSVFEGLLIIDCFAHWLVSASCKSYIQNPYNVIDLLAVLPLPLRLAVGIPLPSMEENLVVHVILLGIVPLLRLLKMVRRFHKLQLLLHVLSTTIDALKLLLFFVSIIVLLFSIVLYIVDDPIEIDSLSTAIYMCIVTVTTVGYGDITPKSWPAKVVSGCLCFISVLFMAMPLSVVGNAMSETWSDRHRILLVTRARRRLKNWGVSADDLPKIFKKFDADGNGELGMDEFIDFISRMKVGIKPSEASDLFLAFDSDGSGGIDEKEFMKTLFPLDYRRIYRRGSANP